MLEEAKPFVCCFVVDGLQPSFSTGCSFERERKKGAGHQMSASGYLLLLNRKFPLSPSVKGFRSLQTV